MIAIEIRGDSCVLITKMEVAVDLSQPLRETNEGERREIDFEIITAGRSNQKVLYSKIEMQLYSKKRVLKSHGGGTVYNCRIKTCNSTILLTSDTTAIKPQDFVQHNHEDQRECYEKFVVRNRLLKAAVDAAVDKNLTEVYRDTVDE